MTCSMKNEDEVLNGEDEGVNGERISLRSKSMEVWQSMVNAENSKGLSVTEELITLSVMDMFLCL